jgi:hypothetical protein
MSLSALRNTTPGPRGMNAGAEVQPQRSHEDGSWLRSVDRDRTDRATITTKTTVALEPHWQASIEIATD